MKTLILVEKISKRKYRASIAQPIAEQKEAATRDEAIQRLCEAVRQRLAEGELIPITLADQAEDNPWVAFAGIWKEHPDFAAFRQNIADYRRQTEIADSSS